MAKIKTVIVEDEDSALFILKSQVSKYRDLELIAEYRNGLEGLHGINETKPDLVFVDVDMPVMNGFKMLQKIKCEPAIIFCTGHKGYALKAWDYNAADFLSKPVDPSRFEKALERALSDIQNRRQNERISHQRKLAGLENVTWVDINNNKIARFFSADEIFYIKSDADYIKFFLVPEVLEELKVRGDFISLKMTVKKATETWEKHGFKRAHRRYLVNIDKILSWNKSKMILKLKGVDEEIPVGRVYNKDFKNISMIK